MLKQIILTSIWLFWACLPLPAQDKVFVIDSAKFGYLLNTHTYFLIDSLNRYTFEQVSSPAFTPQMHIFTEGYQLQCKTKQNYWYKVTLTNRLPHKSDFVYEPSALGLLDFNIYDTRGKLLYTRRTGKSLPFSQYDWYVKASAIRLSLTYRDTITIVTRAYEPTQMTSTKDIWLGTPDAYYGEYIDSVAFHLAFQGSLLVLFLYNILFFWIVRDRAYLFYALYTFFTATAFLQGNLIKFFPTREYPAVTELFGATGAFITLFYAQFIYHFLGIKHRPSLLRTGFPYWVYFRWAINSIIIVNFAENPEFLLQNGILGIILILDLAWGFLFINTARKKTPILAMYMVSGYLCLAIPLTVVLGAQMRGYNYEEYAVGIQIGIWVEVVLFSLGLGYRSKATERERVEALQENQRIIEEQNAFLEEKVEERTHELNKQKEAIEEYNKNIVDNINYAKRIQEAFLPKPETIAHYLPEYFIFFRPKDIVSGDFYFVEEVAGKVIVSAIDCTGHGVSGAFMTMLGNDILHNLIDNQRITAPDILLNELHKGVRQALKQAETDNRDGMDLSLISIDRQARQVSFAGAKNPLIYIQHGELHTIKADKMPIGGEQREQERIFTRTDIKIDAPAMFYLFSDGFQDQFGGKSNKKFSIARMKELFLQIHTQDMQTQRETLEQALDAWQAEAGEAQIDDVLVLGVRL